MVIGIDYGQRDTLEEMKRHVQEQDIPHPMLWDEKGRNSGRYGVRAFPAGFLLDAEGKVIWEGVPVQKLDAIEALIRKALEQVKPPSGDPP